MVKKITIAAIALAILLGIGVILYFIFSAPSEPGEKRTFFGNLPIIGGRAPLGTPTPAPQPTSARPPEAEQPIRQIVDKEVLAPALSRDEKNIFYVLRENGHAVASDLNGDNGKDLTALTVLETFDALWSPKKDRVAMSYYEGNAVKRFLNATATGTPSRFLPPETTALDWSPDGLSIAYFTKRAADTALIIADADNKNPRVVYTTPIPDLVPRWISKNIILLISRPSGLAPSLILRFDAAARRADTILSGLNGAVITPSPDGASFVLSTAAKDGQAAELILYALKDRKVTSLFNFATIAEKCAFSRDGKKLYCGVPKNAIAKPAPDQWYKGSDSFSDSIIEVDLATNQTVVLMENEADVDVISPVTTKDGKYFFFIDKKTSTLWRVTLDKNQESESEKK